MDQVSSHQCEPVTSRARTSSYTSAVAKNFLTQTDSVALPVKFKMLRNRNSIDRIDTHA